MKWVNEWSLDTSDFTRVEPGFSFRGGGGGAQEIICARTHITSAEAISLSAGVQGPLKGPGSSRVVLMLSRAIWALLLSILIKKLGENPIVYPILGGACCSPLGSATVAVTFEENKGRQVF